MNKHEMTYALKDDQLVHISQVDSGIACNCRCPSCGEVLVAKKGNRKIHHFAHYNSDACESGYETSLHLLAKEVLSEAKQMVIPAVYVIDKNPDWRVSSKQTICIDDVRLERRVGNIIPDIIVSSKDRELLIEIYVTHPVDVAKLENIKSLHLSCLEIDLSQIKDEISKEMLACLLTQDCLNSRWVYNVYADSYYKVYIQVQQKLKLKVHGFALHAMDCPIKARIWKGIPYANVMDDCTGCEYYGRIEYDTQGESEYLCCTGKTRIHSLDSLRSYLASKRP